jgi:UDP-N-acetylmuramoyl-tripeptide--D-alanyl-D-alanine ligase
MRTTSGFLGRKIVFGRGPDFEARAEAIRRLADGTLEFVLGLGRDSARVHLEFLNEAAIENVLAAAGAAMAMGIGLDKMVPVITGLRPSPRRGEVRRLSGGTVLYDDSYNSNPRALEAALASLAGVQAGRRVAVLGDMLELGEKEGEFHRQAGRVLARSGWDVLVAVGPLASLIAEGALESGLDRGSIHLFQDSGSAAARITRLIRPGDLVLVKGSRGIKTDIIVDAVIREGKE